MKPRRTVYEDEGGPAFPFTRPGPVGGTEHYPGTSLRDLFAMACAAGILARNDWSKKSLGAVAYRYADSMLEARGRSND